MSFKVDQQWSNLFPKMSRPEIVGYFSVNRDRQYLADLSQLKYLYYYGNIDYANFNLNHGLDKVIRKPESVSEEKLNHLLQWILLNYEKIKAPPKERRWLNPMIVCFRGLLSRIWRTPFEDSDGWIICAVKFQGTIYLCGFETEEEKQRRKNATPRDLQMCSWGYKFEQFLLTDSPEKKPNISEPVLESEEFCGLYTSKFNSHLLFYGAEMDGVKTDKPLKEPVSWKDVNFIELKTNRIIETARQDAFFRKKLLKWWCQCFLVGIEDVVCGFRTNDGRVIDCKGYKVSELIKMAKNHWMPSACMNFADAFLLHLEAVVTEDYNKCIYKFSWNPGGEVEMVVLNSQDQSKDFSQYAFLPQWFIEKATALISN